MSTNPGHPAAGLRALGCRWQREMARAADAGERVHAARVAMKEARAVLRLFRRLLPEGAVEGWEPRLRQAMKQLAPARDGAVMRGVLEEQVWRLERDADWEAVWRVLPAVPDVRSSGWRRIGPLLAQMVEELEPELALVDWDRVMLAWARSRREAGRLQARAGRDEEPALWHRWRRRVKALAYQADFVAGAGGPEQGRLRREAWRLQAKLGDLQDLHLTLDHLDSFGLPRRTRKSLRKILRRACEAARRRAWQARLQTGSLAGHASRPT